MLLQKCACLCLRVKRFSLFPLCLRAEAIQREGGGSSEAGERQDSDFVDKFNYFYKITIR